MLPGWKTSRQKEPKLARNLLSYQKERGLKGSWLILLLPKMFIQDNSSKIDFFNFKKPSKPAVCFPPLWLCMFDSSVFLPVCCLKVWAVFLHRWKCVMLAMQASWKICEYMTASVPTPHFSQDFPVWAGCRAMPHETEVLKKCMLCHEITVQEKWGEPKTKRNLSSQ